MASASQTRPTALAEVPSYDGKSAILLQAPFFSTLEQIESKGF
jgi:hypothetical protein